MREEREETPKLRCHREGDFFKNRGYRGHRPTSDIEKRLKRQPFMSSVEDLPGGTTVEPKSLPWEKKMEGGDKRRKEKGKRGLA